MVRESHEGPGARTMFANARNTDGVSFPSRNFDSSGPRTTWRFVRPNHFFNAQATLRDVAFC